MHRHRGDRVCGDHVNRVCADHVNRVCADHVNRASRDRMNRVCRGTVPARSSRPETPVAVEARCPGRHHDQRRP